MTKKRVILVGIGGATCSGKTTLAKRLRKILPNCVIIHQDDFAPPQDQVPVHPVYKWQDWDAAPGAILWPKLVSFLTHVKTTGDLPADHRSHDHLNAQKLVNVDDAVINLWRDKFAQIEAHLESRGEVVKWGLVDGFLLYWNPEVVRQLDFCIFLRVPEATLKHRRHERHGYHTAVQSDPEGSLWRDPPEYWEHIVWPAYVDAHKNLFSDGDIEHGTLELKDKPSLLMEGLESTLSEMVGQTCTALSNFVAPA